MVAGSSRDPKVLKAETEHQTIITLSIYRVWGHDVTNPYKLIGFGAIVVTKPYKFMGFGPGGSHYAFFFFSY